MPPSASGNSSRLTALALGLALVGAASMVYYQFGLFMPRVEKVRAVKLLAGGYSFGDDFYPIWLTSREWLREHRDPYSPAVTRDIQIGLFGRSLIRPIPDRSSKTTAHSHTPPLPISCSGRRPCCPFRPCALR